MIARLLEIVALGVRNLRGYPLRTFLTMLGVVFGVSSVILMRAVGAGAEAELLREIGRLGIDNIIVNSVKPPEQKTAKTDRSFVHRYGLRFQDLARIEATVPGLKHTLPVHAKAERVWSGSRKIEATLYGVTGDHMRLLGLEVARGRQITALDNERFARVCVVRESLLSELPSFTDPLERRLRVGDELYQVVGILADERLLGYAGKALAIDQRTVEVYVPFETLIKREGTTSIMFRSGTFEATDVELSQLVIGVRDVDRVVETAKMVGAVIEKGHEDRDYEVVVPIEHLRQRQRTQQVFNLAFLAIASISLLVGGIGIANIMLATVTERTREIGIRRALGATRQDVVAQFLAETTIIASSGGVLGVLSGLAFDALLGRLTGWTTIVTPSSVAMGLLVSMAVGIVSGIFPARRAALLDPIAALRQT